MKYLLILISLIIVVSCNRKVHTEKTENHQATGESHTSDSLRRVIKTLSEAYESLLQSTSSTDVVFECPPCDSTKVSNTGGPHIINEVKINPDGSKEFKGNISGYKDNATITQKINQVRQSIIDSMNRSFKKDTVYKKADTIEITRTVKSTFIPIWLWIVLAIVGALWLNERFSIFKIPFITRTSLFTKK